MQVIEELEAYAPVRLSAPNLTERAFLQFCERYPDCQIEYSEDGEIEIMPPAALETGTRNMELSYQLQRWSRRDKRGKAFDSSSGFLLPNGARRSPDSAWADKSRLDASRSPNVEYPKLCPDFAIELRLKTDRPARLHKKMTEWIGNGARLGWLIDPVHRSVAIYRPGEPPELLRDPREVRGEGPVAGFVLKMKEVWAGL